MGYIGRGDKCLYQVKIPTSAKMFSSLGEREALDRHLQKKFSKSVPQKK